MIARGLCVLLLALGQAAAQDLDVIRLKDGRRCKGVIIDENDTEVVLQIIVRNSKGGIAVAGTQTYAKSEIAEIVRMPREAREREKEQAEAFRYRGMDRYLRLQEIRVEPVAIGAWRGLRASGDLFEVRTTCDEDFARDACDVLQQAYKGYLRHFKLRRRATGRLPVTILADRAQYDAFVRQRYGATILNPAFYHIKENMIVAYNLVREDEAARIRARIREDEEKIEEYGRLADEEEKRLDREEKEAREAVQRDARNARNRIRRANPANRAALLQRVNRMEKDELARIRRWRAEADEKLAKYREELDDAMSQRRRTIRHNEKVLRDQNRLLFETLFHECFHAFARNRLFGDTEIPRWLNEGMASYFEMSVVEGDELIHGAPHRAHLKVYREAARDGQLPRLDTVLRARGDVFVVLHQGRIDRSNRAYAVSWAVAHYLGSRMTREQMDRYLSDVASGADAAQALAKAFGKPLREIDNAVRAHVASLR